MWPEASNALRLGSTPSGSCSNPNTTEPPRVGVPLSSLSIDVTRMMYVRGHLQTASDAACQAAVDALDTPHFIATGELLPEPTFNERVRVMCRHLDLMVEVFGEELGCRMFRKIAPW